MKKTILLIMLIALLLPLVTACQGETENPPKAVFTVEFSNVVLFVDTVNTKPQKDKTSAYTRDYRKNDKQMLSIGEGIDGYTAIGIRYVVSAFEEFFEIISVTANDFENIPIPVNGFIICVPTEKLTGARLNVGQLAKVNGFFENVSSLERMEYGYLTVDSEYSDSKSRRVSYINPVAGIKDEVIYFISEEYTGNTSLPENSFAVKLNKVSSSGYRVVSIDNATNLDKGSCYLVFVGEYNITYVNAYIQKEQKIMLSREERINSFSDVPALVIEETAYRVENSFFNSPTTDEDGLYLYNADFEESVTPSSQKSKVDVVVIDDTVVYKGERVYIPQKDGVVFSFCGDKSEIADRIAIGDNLPTVLVSYKKSVEGEKTDYSLSKIAYNGVNITRGTDMTVLYKDIPRTKTNAYGYEIIVDSNGMVIGSSYSGDSVIPNGGFVLSAHGENVAALESAYATGETVVLDIASSQAMIIKTPLVKIFTARENYEEANNTFKASLSRLDNMDCEAISSALTELGERIVVMNDKLASYDYRSAIELSNTINEQLSALQYQMIPTHAVENRAVWYRGGEKNDDDVIATLKKMKSLNVNTLYIETWYNGRTIGYSDIEYVTHCPANGEYDALEGFCRLSKSYGIEIHAWCENFFVGTLEEGTSNPLSTAYYDKLLLDKTGKNYNYISEGNSFVFLNPYDSECRQLILDIYREMLTKYDLDGLHLDYIRFPEWNHGTDDYGYNENIIEAFREEYNTDIDPHSLTNGELYNNWVNFRIRIITSFVEEVRALIKEVKPETWLSCATYPMVDEVRGKIYQDVKDWTARGLVDEVFSMTYGTDNAYVSENSAMYADFCKGKAFYSTGLSCFGETPADTFALQMSIPRQKGSIGIALFSLGNITKTNYMEQVQKGAFRSPSVQAYKLNETVRAYANEMLQKTDGVYRYHGKLSAENQKTVKDFCNALIADADSFDSEKSTAEEKIAYCESVVEKCQDFAFEFAAYFPAELQESAKKEFIKIIQTMNLTAYRLQNK